MATISLNNLSKIYDGNINAVCGISLEVPDRQLMVILGPSGCGKSTILHMITGQIKPTGGSISINGTIIGNTPPQERNIAMVFQNHQLYPHMNIYKNIAFGLKMHKLPKDQIKSKVMAATKELGIEELLKRKPHTLSGGQRQLVAIAKTIVREPAVCLFDEPLSNLDAQIRIDIRNKIKSLHAKRNWTTIYVTHDQDEAMALAQNICLINAGTIQQVAPPLEIYNKPANRFAGEFIGAPAMNFFTGRLSNTDKTKCIQLNNGSVINADSIDCKQDDFADNKLTLGIRPEDMTILDNQIETTNTIRATIESIELHGHRMIINLTDTTGHRFAINESNDLHPRINSTVTIQLNPQKTRLFSV